METTTDLGVTMRAVIDPLRLCHLRCDFCYYLHGDMESIRPWEDVRKEMHQHAARGSIAFDVTGGEPLRYPHIADLCREAKMLGMTVRIISSLNASRHVVKSCLDAGVDGWLVSCHGAEPETHDAIVHIKRARAIQTERLTQIRKESAATIDFNYVMIRRNQSEIARFAEEWCPHWSPRVVNYINFNPHYEWRRRPDTADLVVDLRETGPQLDAAIGTLEAAGVGCTVRYFPMCALAERNRHVISNDLQVAFDSGEWNNGIPELTDESAMQYGRRLSMANEEKGAPCNRCDAQWICGGANKWWHQASHATYGEQLVPLSIADGDHNDALFYRRHSAAARVP